MARIISPVTRQLDPQVYEAHTAWREAGGKGPGRLVVEGELLGGFHASTKDLRGAVFTDSMLSKGNLTHADLSHARLLGCDLSKVDFHFTKFAKATIIGCTFEGSRLSLATLEDAKLIGCNLRDVNASRILISNTSVKRCDFDAALVDASLESSRFEDCSFRDSIISRKASGGRLGRAVGCTFSGCDFRDVDFTAFQISECRFDGCLFHGAKGAPELGDDVVVRGADLSAAGDGSVIVDPEAFLARWRDARLTEKNASRVTIDGARIETESDFHELLAANLDFPDYYGKNLDALWDVLTGMLERPVTLVWKNHAESEKALGPRFRKIVDLMKRVEQDDAHLEPSRRFVLRLE